MTITRTGRPTALRVPNRMITNTTTTIPNARTPIRSIEMYTLHEALARERLRATERDAQQLRVARELASARRWHRLEVRAHAAGRRARAAERRHALRAV
jgi:hypothetical protein